jgi:OmpA-OmpF porin, OOP family
MRKITLIAIIAILAIFSTNIKAQNTDHRWALGVYMNWVDYNMVHYSFANQIKQTNWQGPDQMIPSKFSVGRFISPSFNVVGAFASNRLELDKMSALGQELGSNKFWDADANLEYKFANGYILKETSWFDPYVYAGFGVSNVWGPSMKKSTAEASGPASKGLSFAKQVTGVGFNFWVLPYLGLNFHAQYDYVFDRDDYAHYAAGIKFRFGGGKDMDKDGIPDKKDLCPTVFGLKELAGCPDKDGDGIADKDDACPDVAGPKELNGCPDTDGDGILDKDDLCPTVKGSAAMKGCPDKDGDGIADKDDLCPDVAGLAKFSGCPDKDGDGIPDKDDKCPDVAGIAANFGCPEVKVEPVKVIEISKIIYFASAKDKFAATYNKDLDEVVAFMKENGGIKLNINGYADSQGPDGMNMKLSDRRAINVLKYLKLKGVTIDRMTKTAYGEANPVGDNTKAEGRAQNRRVEIKTAK